ncbi:MAG: hypothetical protein ACPGC8_06975 [Flavobacteriaceae bacterium]
MIQYYLRYFSLAFILIFFQILIFNHVNLFGFSNPTIYIILLIVYRLTQDQFGFILISFILGFLIDLLTQTAGAHSIACVTTAFVRPVVSRFALGENYDQPYAMFTGTLLTNRLLYVFLIILIHQLIFAFVAYFSMAHFWIIFKHSITNTLFSFILIAATINLLQPKK